MGKETTAPSETVPFPMKRLTVIPMPDLPRALCFFRCPTCRTVVPETRWSEREARQYLVTHRATVCEGCQEEPPAERVRWEERDG